MIFFIQKQDTLINMEMYPVFCVLIIVIKKSTAFFPVWHYALEYCIEIFRVVCMYKVYKFMDCNIVYTSLRCHCQARVECYACRKRSANSPFCFHGTYLNLRKRYSERLKYRIYSAACFFKYCFLFVSQPFIEKIFSAVSILYIFHV